MRLLVCGSRGWRDVERIYAEMASLLVARDEDVVIHGDAPGADRLAHECAGLFRVAEFPFPADWKKDGKAAGPIRNARMLADGKPDWGLAFGPLWKRDAARTTGAHRGWRMTGTGDMVSRMLRAGLPVRWVASPDAAAVDLSEMPGPGSAG